MCNKFSRYGAAAVKHPLPSRAARRSPFRSESSSGRVVHSGSLEMMQVLPREPPPPRMVEKEKEDRDRGDGRKSFLRVPCVRRDWEASEAGSRRIAGKVKRVARQRLEAYRGAGEKRGRYGTITPQYLADESSVYYLLEQTRALPLHTHPPLQWLAGSV